MAEQLAAPRPEYYEVIKEEGVIPDRTFERFQESITYYRKTHDVKEATFCYFYASTTFYCVATFCCYGEQSDGPY